MTAALSLDVHGGSEFVRACRIVNSFIPSRMRSGPEAQDFVQGAILELRSKNGIFCTDWQLIILVAKRRIFDRCRSPESRYRMVNLDMIESSKAENNIESKEAVDGILDRIETLEGRSMVILKMRGYTKSEIAVMSGRSVRWVQRLFKKLAKQVT